MKNQLQLVTNHQAKELYELGFNWETNHYYPTVGNDLDIIHDLHQTLNVNQLFEDKIAAPTVALALKWFRDVHGEFFTIDVASTKKYMAQTRNRETTLIDWAVVDCNTYEDAEMELLYKFIADYSLPF
ncbi:MAG: hypothetical protein FWD09_02335 [Lentimicrobiaceae bacterium]|nr:hypothetical protein [Lentimicrobiaceae bacterium]